MPFTVRVFVILSITLGLISGDEIPRDAGSASVLLLEKQQEVYRRDGQRAAIELQQELESREHRNLDYDDDHLYSSAPTENTYAPTPSGTTSYTSTCLSNCSAYDASSWNLDNWCKLYWDAGCYLPDVNFLGIDPAGKALVSNYSCVPSCLSGQTCGASYCRIFSHLYSSCRTGYAHLDFNSSLQDQTHEQCLVNYMEENFAAHGLVYNTSNLTTLSWRASFTLSPVTVEALDAEGDDRGYVAIRSATAHLLSGVDTSGVSLTFVGDISVYAPTFVPTPAPTSSAAPTTATPSSLPTSAPTTNDSVICSVLEQRTWCNENQENNIDLGVADNATHCQELCNTYVGADFASGCCLWYTGNKEPLYETGGCALQPDAGDTPWEDSHFFWMSSCSSVSAEPTPNPTPVPTLAPGANGVPSPSPTVATPLPTRGPTTAPTLHPSAEPTAFPTDPTAAPTFAPTSPQEGIRVVLQINSSVESLGLDPLKTEIEAYLQLSSELTAAFGSAAFDESLWLASTSYEANSTLGSAGHDLDTELYGYDSPTPFPTSVSVNTPAPTPTLYFDPNNSTLSSIDDDETAVIAGSTAAAVVGSGAVGAVAYNYATSDLAKVAQEGVSDLPEISV